jgi:RNA polymerase sigma-70 factor (ECF subfamily)
MSVCEGRGHVERLAPSLRQPRREIRSPGLAPILAPSILPDRLDTSSASGQPEPTSNGKLAYAVRNATEAEENTSDAMLLKHVAEGDKAAMHILFARHRTKVFRFVQRMVRNPAIAEDLVSQVFLDVWRCANRFENRARVSTWLLSIARFKAINTLRRRAYESADLEDVPKIADTADTPEAALDRKETNGILQACISKLSPAHREIIELFYYREKSAAELSETIGIPLATVKSRIFYARKQLAKSLVGAGIHASRGSSYSIRQDVIIK